MRQPCGNNESAGKRRSGRLRRGNATLGPRWPSVPTARCAPRAPQFALATTTRSRRACRYKRAILATAHKLLRTIVAMLRDQRPYIDPGIDYEQLVVHRNAARWLRKLDQYGYLDSLRTGPQPTVA